MRAYNAPTSAPKSEDRSVREKKIQVNAVKRVAIGATLGSAVGIAFLLGSSGTANADTTHVCIGGYGDNMSEGIAAAKAAQGFPCNVKVQWPASMGLPGEPTNVQGSLNVGVPNAVDAYDAARPGLVVLEGNSLGTIAAAQAGDYITRVRGGAVPDKPLQVITNGNPYGDSGIDNDPAIAGLGFDIAKPFLGLPQDVPQQGINRNDVNDIWGNSANQWPQTQIADVASVQWNHTDPDPRAPHDTYVTQGEDGPVINEVYGVGENPVSAAAARNGTPVPPPVDLFFDGFFPVNNPADPGVNANFAPAPLPVGDSFPAAGPVLP